MTKMYQSQIKEHMYNDPMWQEFCEAIKHSGTVLPDPEWADISEYETAVADYASGIIIPKKGYLRDMVNEYESVVSEYKSKRRGWERKYEDAFFAWKQMKHALVSLNQVAGTMTKPASHYARNNKKAEEYYYCQQRVNSHNSNFNRNMQQPSEPPVPDMGTFKRKLNEMLDAISTAESVAKNQAMIEERKAVQQAERAIKSALKWAEKINTIDSFAPEPEKASKDNPRDETVFLKASLAEGGQWAVGRKQWLESLELAAAPIGKDTGTIIDVHNGVAEMSFIVCVTTATLKAWLSAVDSDTVYLTGATESHLRVCDKEQFGNGATMANFSHRVSGKKNRNRVWGVRTSDWIYTRGLVSIGPVNTPKQSAVQQTAEAPQPVAVYA